MEDEAVAAVEVVVAGRVAWVARKRPDLAATVSARTAATR